jgi:hypothetical protein
MKMFLHAYTCIRDEECSGIYLGSPRSGDGMDAWMHGCMDAWMQYEKNMKFASSRN